MSIALRLSRLRASCRPYVLFCVVISTAVMLAACGTSSTSSPSGTASSGPTPVASGLGATSSASPDASSTASAVEASPGASATAGGGVDACTLVTPAAIVDIVGVVKPAEMPSGGWLTSGCSWGGSTASFIISIGTASSIQKFGDPAAPDVKAKLQQYKQQANGSDVTGIGDAAVLGANGMAAYKGGTYVEVEKLRLTDAQLTKIMTLLMSRL